jgi:glucose-1-phosphate cytidylyltransferase
MKVVLFCGGQGTRLRDYSEAIPKPMIPIGYRPILWHVMKYYAHHGHKDFILCLGHKGDVIKKFFLNYDEAISNDFVIARGGREVRLLNSDIDDWTITFVDTGIASNIGERLLAVREHLKGEEMFLANYSDGLTDMPLGDAIDAFQSSADKVASLVAVKPNESFYIVSLGDGGEVTDIGPIANSDTWLNGGFFIFRQEIFDYVRPGEELANEPFKRLIAEGRLMAYSYTGFWEAMDTFKDKQRLDDLFASGKAPWQVWNGKSH